MYKGDMPPGGYIEACCDFHAKNLPIVGDHIGGLPGLSTLAFGAIGGVAHGVTVQQSFKAASWRLPRVEKKGGCAGSVEGHPPISSDSIGKVLAIRLQRNGL